MNNFCPSCGQKIAVAGQFCNNCGCKLVCTQANSEAISNVDVGYNNNYNNYNNYNKCNSLENDNNYTNGMGIAGFVIALVSWFFCCGSLSWLGLIFSIIGLNNAKRHNDSGKGISIAGLTISIIGLLILLIFVMAFVTGVVEGMAGITM